MFENLQNQILNSNANGVRDWFVYIQISNIFTFSPLKEE